MKKRFTLCPRNLSFAIICLILFFISSGTKAQFITIAEWTFESSLTADVTSLPVNTSEVLTVAGGVGTPTSTTITGTTNGTGNCASANTWAGALTPEKYWQVKFSTQGYGSLRVSSSQVSQINGPRDFKIQYSTTGLAGSWTDVTGATSIVLSTNWTSGVVTNINLDISLEDKPEVYLRWIKNSTLPVSGPGIVNSNFSGIDNILIEGIPLSTIPAISISSNSPAAGDILRGSTNNVLVRYDLAVSDRNTTPVSVTMPTAGTYITTDIATNGFKLWQSTDDQFDSGSDQLLQSINAVASGGNLVFSSIPTANLINAGETGYLFITCDLTPGAGKGNTIFINSINSTNNFLFSPVADKSGTTLPISASNIQTIDCIDNNSEVLAGPSMPGSASISSLANDIASAMKVMEIYLWDLGTCDGLNTIITNIRIQPNSGSNTVDWTDHIGGIFINEQGGDTVITNPPIITDTYIDIPIPPGNLVIPNNQFPIYEFSVYLNATDQLVDNAVLAFYIDGSNHGFTTDPVGSGFNPILSNGSIYSSDFTIAVDASELLFAQQPQNTDANDPMAVDVSVQATDIHGNRDLDFNNSVALTSSGTMIGDPISVAASSGLATWQSAQPSEQIVHTVEGTNLTLTASSGVLTNAISSTFNIIQLADHLSFVGVPAIGQVGSSINQFTVEARKPDESVDTNYSGDVTISINTGPGNVSGTLTQSLVSGVATFDDINFDAAGNYTLAADLSPLTQGISSNIAIVGADESVFPNGRETMNVAITSPSTIAEHDAGNGFINTGVLTFNGGGVSNEADIRNTDISSGYANASGGSNVFFTSTTGDYGFAMEGIDASTYTNLTLQFAVRKENAAGTPFASLTVEYWDGNNWQPITITDYPLSSDGTGWKLLSSVSLPAAAEISNLGLRWAKTGDYACRIDDVSLTGTPKAATNLIVATINGGLPPVVNVPFNVDIQVQDGSGSPANVLENTNVQLSLNTGTGALGGTITTTILAGTNSATISGVTYNTSETGVIISANRLSGDDLSGGNSSPFNVLAVEPTVSASVLTIGTRTTTSIDISWTNGDGSERIVLAKQGTPVDQDPVDGSVYTANADFTLGTDIGNGNIVVLAGPGNSVSITNLQPENTTYHFAIYEYNGTGGLQNYKQSSPETGSALTTCSDPSTQASALTFSNIMQSSMDLSWTDGDGTGRIVIMNSVNVFTDPVDGDDTYTADPSWNNAGQQVVYFADGAGSTVTISNLSAASTYYYRVYEYNCSGVDINYKTDVYNTASTDTYLFTQDFTNCPPAGWLNVRIAGDQDWTCAGGYASVSGLGSSAPSEMWYITPAINFNLIADEKLSFDSWTSGTDDTHPKLFVMYSLDYTGSGNPYAATWDTLTYNTPTENSQSWTASGPVDLSLINDNAAYLAFQYSSTGTSAGSATEWRIDNVQIIDQACVTPSVATTNLSYSNITQSSMTLNWSNGDGIGRLVLIKEGSAVDFNPSLGEVYTASSDFTDPADPQITGGNKAVYSDGGSSVTVTGLNPGNTYHFAVYEFNCNGTNRTYAVTALIGSQSTLDPNGSDIVVTSGYSYNTNIDYVPYNAISSLSQGITIDLVRLTIQDEGFINVANSDGSPTELTNITFSTNGSYAIRAAGLFLTDGTNVAEKLINGGDTIITFDNITPGLLVAPSDGSIDFDLRVTFEDNVLDNEQIVINITSATANLATSLFYQPDAGGARSIDTDGDENKIRVVATSLEIMQGPSFSVPINEEFTLEVEAIDTRNSRDLDKTLTISNISGAGSLSSSTSLTKSTGDSTAVWSDLIYNLVPPTVDNTEFEISDGGTLTVSTGSLKAKPRFTIFTFTGNIGSEPTAPADINPVNITISEISRGSGISAAALADAFSASSWPSTQDVNSYYEITVTPNPGFQVNLSSIEFDHRRSSSSTGPTNWVLQNSANTNTQSDVILGDGDWDLNRNAEALLSIGEENPVTFQLFAYGASNGNATWAVDNIEIFGTITDVDPPAFTSGYPQADSTAISGFDLSVNLTESATVYYVIQDPDVVLTAPDLNQVINGLNGDGAGAVVANTIAVASPAIDVFERVTGLLSDNVYDVYYVLYDGTYYSAVIPQTGLPTSDTNTNLVATTQPAGPYEIPSTATQVEDLVNVFNFQISDLGTADGAPTNVTQLVFNAGSNNTVADWSTVIGGLILYNVTEDNYVAISNISIIGTSIIINFNPGDLSIDNGSAEEIALSIHLTGTVTDESKLEFTLGGDPHTNTTSAYGSQFSSVLTLLTSNTYTILVDGYRLSFDSYPTNVDTNVPFSVTVIATDANGNQDSGNNSTVVSLSKGLGIGSLSSASSPATMTGGTVTFSDVLYSGNNELFTIIASDNASTLLPDTTNNIQVGTLNDLIVTSTMTLTSDLSVANVDIQSTGDLTISSGVTLGVTGNFNIDGVLNGTSGTVDFNGTVQQQITGTSSPTDFYNITISNSAASVIAEIDINLHNTLSIGTGALMDLDGVADNRNFTLVSTPTYTARIGQMGDGATINGEVIWQRSLRTGPQGWRYIGTPIKGQNLGSISDDVWIQGIAERYPNAWTNIATYNEPVGTEGQAGFEGWQDFTSNADNLNVGKGMKLWLWNIDYATEQVIVMKGQPFIGDGGDGVAGSTEDITLNTSFTSTAYDGGGWNFFANPYPSELDWNQVIKDANINGEAVHIWNPNTQSYGSYSPLSGGISINGVTQYIASGQGFFVKAEAGGAFIRLSESSKASADGNSFLRISDEPLANIKVELSSANGKKDETAVTFSDLASDSYDSQFDVRKLAGGYINLSSVIDEKQIAINAMGEKRGVQSVRLNIDPYVYGSFTMKFPQMDAFEEGAIIRLIDKYLDKTKYINSASTYVFNIDENNPDTYGADRFEIQFVEPARFKFDQPTAKAGQEFIMPVFADKLEDIMNANMAVSWDKEALTFVGIEDTGMGDISNFDLTMIESGKLVYSDERMDPLSLPDGSQLFSIRFMAKNGMPQAQLRFEQAMMSLKAINNIDMPFSSEDVLIDILQNRFVSGAIATYSGELVNDVKITAQNPVETIEKTSKMDGSYALDTYEQSEYSVSAIKSTDGLLAEAITTLDIIKTRGHILGKEAFASPYQWIAADVNGSQTITAIDLVEMRKVILGIIPSFQSGLDWLIIPDSYDLSNDPFGYQTSVDITLTDQDIDLDFVGVKVGDVDNSWTNNDGARRSKIDFALSLENMFLDEDLIEIPVTVSQFSDIRGYQFTVTWDPGELQFYGANSEKLEGFFNEQMTDEGVLTTLWDELQGEAFELKEGDILMTLQFRALHEDAASEVAINSSVTPAVAFDGKLNAMSVSASPAVVNLEELRNGSMELFQNVPNPFDFTTEIGFKLPKSGLVRLSIVNTLGEIIYLHEDHYKAGVYNISWDRSQGMRTVSPGVYLYRLESNGEEVVKKMVIK